MTDYLVVQLDDAGRRGGVPRGLAYRLYPRFVEYPVVLLVPGTDDVLTLTDYMAAKPGVGNLARFRSDGTEVWRVAPDALSQDVWTAVRVDTCRASTWQGWEVVLDLQTGEARERRYTK